MYEVQWNDWFWLNSFSNNSFGTKWKKYVSNSFFGLFVTPLNVKPPQDVSDSQILIASFGLKYPFSSGYSKHPGGIRPSKNFDFCSVFFVAFFEDATLIRHHNWTEMIKSFIFTNVYTKSINKYHRWLFVTEHNFSIKKWVTQRFHFRKWSHRKVQENENLKCTTIQTWNQSYKTFFLSKYANSFLKLDYFLIVQKVLPLIQYSQSYKNVRVNLCLIFFIEYAPQVDPIKKVRSKCTHSLL